MSLKIGIIGLPNVGKSTLFNALVSQKKAKVSDYPFCTIEPNKGVVEVPDRRLKRIAQALEIDRTVPATLEFIDIAGLVKGAHKGEGLGNEFLSHIQQVDLLCQVLPHFKDPEKSKAQIKTIKTELILKDLQLINQALEEIEEEKEEELLEKVRQDLNKEVLIVEQDLSPEERKLLKKHNLLTDKEIFYLANVKEEELGKDQQKLEIPSDHLVISAKTEEDLTEIEEKEAEKYCQALGLDEKALNKLIRKAYRMLDLISFYTIKEDQSQIQAWPIKKGTTARQAAGMIHSDFAEKFIQAQTVDSKDLIKAGSLIKAAEAGQVKARGENYPIKDREVVNFKHN